MRLSEDQCLTLVGINYKDVPEDATDLPRSGAILMTLSEPTARDGNRSNGVPVPETFVLDPSGLRC